MAGTGLLLAAPVLAGLALVTRLAMGSPVLFRQQRIGRKERTFSIAKFRTMKSGAGSDAERMTTFGSFVRSTSLDELPQLWNVLRGDMSLIGPRPLLPEYLPYYSPDQARRHEVRPGITGWSAVMGRNTLDWDEQLAHDVWYVDHRSLSLDVRILWRTVWTVVARKDIAQEGQATRERFDDYVRARSLQEPKAV